MRTLENLHNFSPPCTYYHRKEGADIWILTKWSASARVSPAAWSKTPLTTEPLPWRKSRKEPAQEPCAVPASPMYNAWWSSLSQSAPGHKYAIEQGKDFLPYSTRVPHVLHLLSSRYHRTRSVPYRLDLRSAQLLHTWHRYLRNCRNHWRHSNLQSTKFPNRAYTAFIAASNPIIPPIEHMPRPVRNVLSVCKTKTYQSILTLQKECGIFITQRAKFTTQKKE